MAELDKIHEADALRLGIEMADGALAPHMKGPKRTAHLSRKLRRMNSLLERGN